MNALHDIRYAFRMLLKRPDFTLIVVPTLAAFMTEPHVRRQSLATLLSEA